MSKNPNQSKSTQTQPKIYPNLPSILKFAAFLVPMEPDCYDLYAFPYLFIFCFWFSLICFTQKWIIKKYFYSRIFFFQKYSLKMKFFLKWFSTSKRWMVLDCSRLLQLPSSPPGRVISTPPEMTVARCHHGNILDLKLGLVLDNARERVPP